MNFIKLMIEAWSSPKLSQQETADMVESGTAFLKNATVLPPRNFDLVCEKGQVFLQTGTIQIKTSTGNRIAYFRQSVDSYENCADLTRGTPYFGLSSRYENNVSEKYVDIHLNFKHMLPCLEDAIEQISFNEISVFTDSKGKRFAIHKDEIKEAKILKITTSKEPTETVKYSLVGKS